MTLITSLADVPADTAEQARASVTQLLAEQNPDVPTRRGLFQDVVVQPASLLAGLRQANIDTVLLSSSPSEVAANPELADDATVDRLASIYGVTRSAGSVAYGNVVVVLSRQIALSVPSGSRFAASDGTSFVTEQAYSVRLTSVEIVAESDRLLQSLGGGLYSFTVPVVSQSIGPDGLLRRGDGLSPPLLDSSVQSAYAAADFLGGTEAEDNATLVARLGVGRIARNLSSDSAAEGLVASLELPSYDAGLSSSMTGLGDPELLRYYGMLPVAYGGRSDLFVRPCENVVRSVVIKSATYVGTDPSGGGQWRFQFDRDEAPGVYEVRRALRASDSNNANAVGLSILTTTRSLDISAVDGVRGPDVRLAAHGSFSRYQVLTVDFLDPNPPTGLEAGVSTADYAAETVGLPSLDVIQDALNDRSVRFAVGDCLVRAPVPCFCSASVIVTLVVGATAPSSSSVKNAVSSAVGQSGFPGKLAAALVGAAAQAAVGTAGTVSSVVMQGRILRPDGTTLVLSSSTSLEPVEDAANQVTPRTVAFFLAPEDVAVQYV